METGGREIGGPEAQGIALVLCEEIRVDAAGSRSLVGLFNKFYSGRFPCQLPRVSFYAVVGKGDFGGTLFHIRLTGPDGGQVWGSSTSVTEWSETGDAEIQVGPRAMVFNRPGDYALRLYDGERLMLERKLLAMELPSPTPGPGLPEGSPPSSGRL